MNRKTKIRGVVAFVVLGLIAITFWLSESKGELGFTVSPVSSNRVTMTITNGFGTTIHYWWSIWSEGSTAHADFGNGVGNIRPHSAETYEMVAYSMTKWRLVVEYNDPSPPSFLALQREKAAQYAWKHDWVRIAKWICPSPRIKRVFGPEMLGNKPASLEQK